MSSTQMTREKALENIQRLRETYGDRAEKFGTSNEATTRLLLIDEILVALGWTKTQFNPEESAGNVGYSDYLLKIDHVPRLVVEAKRTGHTFQSSDRRLKRTNYTLSYVKTAFGVAFTDVLRQAEGYAREHGVPFAALTNGAEWVLAQVIPTPGDSIADLKCYYFGNLLQEGADFDLFWELLAQPAVEQGKLEENFAELNSIEAEYCQAPYAAIGDFQWETTGQDERFLFEFYDAFFDEIVDPARRKMLEYCFVTNTRLDQYQGKLKRVLRDTAPSFLEEADELTPEQRDKILVERLGDKQGRVVLVIGSVGCGKTTLVRKVLLESRQRDDLYCLLVDLIDDVDEGGNDVETLLWKRIFAAWKETLRESLQFDILKKIFGRELKMLASGPKKRLFEVDEEAYVRAESEELTRLTESPAEYLPAAMKYYSGRGKGFAIFLDNVDRASEAYQRRVYAFAHRVARETGATVIVPMREMTYFRGKKTGFLDVRSSDTVLHLQAPDLVQLLSKRIKYVEDRLETDPRLKQWKSRTHAADFFESIVKYAGVLKATFLVTDSGYNNSLELLAAVAWHDVRAFLLYIRHIHHKLGSEHPWQYSHLIAVLMTSTSSGGTPAGIPNVYMPPYPSYSCYFLKVRVLMMMMYAIQQDREKQAITMGQIMQFSRAYGYHDRWTRRAVEEMVRSRLLECLEAPAAADFSRSFVLETGQSFRPSPLAIVVIERLYASQTYLALGGNMLPFHNRHMYSSYVKNATELVELMGGKGLERTGVDLLSDAELSAIVAGYLINAYTREKPVGNMTKYVAGASVVEQRMYSFIKRLETVRDPKTDNAQPVLRDEDKAEDFVSPEQMLINFSDEMIGAAPTEVLPKIPVPPNIRTTKISGSSLGALIFWAMVELRANGKTPVSGSQITRVINLHLTDDHTQKEATNISKALRGKVMQSQPWIITTISQNKRRLFSLNPSWKEWWKKIFNCNPPEHNESTYRESRKETIG